MKRSILTVALIAVAGPASGRVSAAPAKPRPPTAVQPAAGGHRHRRHAGGEAAQPGNSAGELNRGASKK